jgi:FKBP-type peptidyl-prolyl cis-trans isomerase FklB
MLSQKKYRSFMKPSLPILLLALCAALAAPALAQTSTPPTTDKQKLSYALGMDVGGALKKQAFDLDQQTFLNAVRDGLSGTPQMSEEECRKVLMDFSQQLQAKRQAQADSGKPFLAANKAKPDVVSLPSGLQYKVIKKGTGPMPSATDTVTVKYRGTLIDGTVFDDSEKHGGTATFPVNGVIKGWTEALQKMNVGSKWQIFIPADLAYGDRGAGTDIPPGSTLIFDVELVSIAGK